MSELDLSELDTIVAPSDDQLKQIQNLANRQLAAERNVEQAKEDLKEAEEHLRNISWNLLPDAMRACGLEKFKLESGEEIVVKEHIRASISEENRPYAVRWLRENNHGAIIKSKVEAVFMPGDPVADEVAKYLDEHDVEYATKSSVHSATLAAWVKEQLANGLEVPESISYFEQRISKVVK